MRNPDFRNLEAVLECKEPARPTLFEFFIENTISEKLAGMPAKSGWDCAWNYELLIPAMQHAGYDYITMHGSEFCFPVDRPQAQSASMNTGILSNRKDLQNYPFIDPDKCDYSRLAGAEKHLPKGMKIIAFGAGGILENAISLVGYENLCYAVYEDPDFVETLFKEIGERFVAYYDRCLAFDSVAAIVSNDDWGFNTATMLSPEHMRKYVFPWHKKIVEHAHSQGKKAILHSCGNLDLVWDDIINDMKFDGKHSYEDKICPVEEMYPRLQGKIAVLGGIDLDFVCRKTPQEIYERCKNMVDGAKTGYALGTGNSIPNYVPPENFAAMLRAANTDFHW